MSDGRDLRWDRDRQRVETENETVRDTEKRRARVYVWDQ